MNKYFKEFIVCAEIDQYCLLCKETFQFIMDIERHIKWIEHRKKIKAFERIAKYAKDSIHKVRIFNFFITLFFITSTLMIIQYI